MATTRSYFIPGWGYVNEVKGNAYFIPSGGYINETVSSSTTPLISQWLSVFPDRQYYAPSVKLGFDNLSSGITFLPSKDAADWLGQFPDKRKEYLKEQNIKGSLTVDVGVFTKEIVNVDKWSPLFTNRANRVVYTNTGSTVNILPIVVIPVVHNFVPHKRRGQAGTVGRGVSGASGSQEGQ